MKLGLKKGYIVLLSALSFCVSCGDAELFDTDKWSSQVEGWEPGIKGAVARGEFTLWDFLRDTTRDFRVDKELVDGDSILVVKYTEEDIYSVNIAEVFALGGEDIEFQLDLPDNVKTVLENVGSLVIQDVYGEEGLPIKKQISEEIPLPEAFAGTELRSVTLSGGTCTWHLSGFDDLKYDFKVIYKSGGEDVVLLEMDELSGDGEAVVELGNRTFDVELPGNSIELSFEILLKEGTLNGDFGVRLKFSDYDFSKVEGKVVKTGGIAIDRNFFDVDLDILNDVNGSVRFTDPKLELVLKNKGLGLPFGVDMTFTGTNKDGEEGTLRLTQPLLFAGNPSDTNTVSVVQSVSKDNSNIVDFLELLPQGEVYYSGEVTVNPGKEDNNVIYKNASLSMDLNVSVPVAMTGDLSYCDTIADVDLDQKYADKIVEGTIYLNVQENALPLDLSVPKMVLLDEYNLPLDTIAVSGSEDGAKIKAGQQGRLSFHVSEKTAKNLGRMKGILLEAAVSGGTGEPVKANAKLKFVLTLEAKAVIKDYDDF